MHGLQLNARHAILVCLCTATHSRLKIKIRKPIPGSRMKNDEWLIRSYVRGSWLCRENCAAQARGDAREAGMRSCATARSLCIHMSAAPYQQSYRINTITITILIQHYIATGIHQLQRQMDDGRKTAKGPMIKDEYSIAELLLEIQKFFHLMILEYVERHGVGASSV